MRDSWERSSWLVRGMNRNMFLVKHRLIFLMNSYTPTTLQQASTIGHRQDSSGEGYVPHSSKPSSEPHLV